MARFKINGHKLVKYIESDNVMTDIIPDCVTKIEKDAFNSCKNLTSITIPDSVTEIGESAFEDCINLTHIEFPKNVVKIGDHAFLGCTILENIKFNNKILTIPNGAFAYCVSLTNITLPNSITKIGNWAFYCCHSLTDITLPYSVTEIGEGAFESCQNLTSITLSRNITKIGFFALDYRYVKELNVYSYKVFSLLSETTKIIAIISTIKNYYTGKIQYSNQDMNLFKEYIRKNKVKLFESVKENKEIIQVILFEMGNFLTLNDIDELLSKNYEIEINAMLTEYSNKIRNENINPLDEYDLGELGEEGKTKKYK